VLCGGVGLGEAAAAARRGEERECARARPEQMRRARDPISLTYGYGVPCMWARRARNGDVHVRPVLCHPACRPPPRRPSSSSIHPSIRDPRAGRRTTTVAASGRARGSIHCARGVARGQPL
jgi:hypothetical protein